MVIFAFCLKEIIHDSQSVDVWKESETVVEQDYTELKTSWLEKMQMDLANFWLQQIEQKKELPTSQSNSNRTVHGRGGFKCLFVRNKKPR